MRAGLGPAWAHNPGKRGSKPRPAPTKGGGQAPHGGGEVMFALPTWLAIYLSIGLAIVHHRISSPRYPHAPSTWLGCALAVIAVALLWPLLLVVAVRRHG